MPTTPRSQVALAADPAPPPSTPPTEADAAATERHRSAAHSTNPAGMTLSLGLTITNGTNLIAATTTYNFEAFAIETSANDAEIRSQIVTLWDVMAGV